MVEAKKPPILNLAGTREKTFEVFGWLKLQKSQLSSFHIENCCQKNQLLIRH